VQRLDLRIRLGELTRGHACSSLSLPKMSLYARLGWEHGGWAYRRHRARDKSSHPLAVGSRAIFALSTGLPTMGCAIRDQSPRIPRR
jgi:hypothetical protein